MSNEKRYSPCDFDIDALTALSKVVLDLTKKHFEKKEQDSVDEK